MPLEMKPACERCGCGLGHDSQAFVCSYECTFCPACTSAMRDVCPNCGGELLGRPRRGLPGTPAVAPWGVVEGEIVVSDDPARLDVEFIHAFLARSYWSPGIPLEVVRRAVQHSVALGLYERAGDGRNRQVGYARVVTDRATYAYLCDVFVIEAMRGRGLSKLLMRAVMAHPALQGLRRWMLVTRDAHGLYERFGFRPAENPQNVMAIVDRDIYLRAAGAQARGAGAVP